MPVFSNDIARHRHIHNPQQKGMCMKQKHIILTGGGTAGHVTPNIALVPELEARGYRVSYIGSYDGIEKKLIEDLKIPYHGIDSGKLRRYMDLKNLTDPIHVLRGYREAKRIIAADPPDIVFSKGGFVSVPVVYAAAKKHIPVVIHESDMTPGLANKLCYPKARVICCNFPETKDYVKGCRAVVTGTPIRKELLEGNARAGLEFCGLNDSRPVMMVIGGSLGSVVINDAVRRILPALLKDFQIIHLCGKDRLDPALNHIEGYVQYEYIRKELPDLFAAADIVVSRAGANAICEISSLAKPNLLIPLSAKASRGDQVLNAASFEKQGYSMVLREEDLTGESLLSNIKALYRDRERYIRAMQESSHTDSIRAIANQLDVELG